MRTDSPSPRRLRSLATASDGQPPATVNGAARSTALLVAEDVAVLLGVPPAFVYAMARRGELPCVRVGERYVRFRAQAIEAWIVEHESSRPRGTR